MTTAERDLKTVIITMTAAYQRLGAVGVETSGHFSRIALGCFLVDGVDPESAFKTLSNVFDSDMLELLSKLFDANPQNLTTEDVVHLDQIRRGMRDAQSVAEAAIITI